MSSLLAGTATTAAFAQAESKWFVLRNHELGTCWTATLVRIDGQFTGTFERKAGGPYDTEALNTGDKLVLFDTGMGTSQMFGPTPGKMLANLKAAGIDPKDIDAVVATHAHCDHVWGIMGDDGSRNFPNAQIYISQADFDFWTDEAKLAFRAIDVDPHERRTFSFPTLATSWCCSTPAWAVATFLGRAANTQERGIQCASTQLQAGWERAHRSTSASPSSA